jgi:hypothetical protein
MPYIYHTCAGSIRGLFLSPSAWEVLRRENIQTIAQLRAHVDRLEQFDGIDAKTAQVIRQGLARFVPCEEETSSENQHVAWSA